MRHLSEAIELDVAIRLLFFLVSARFCLDTDVGYLRKYFVDSHPFNAKTQYRAIQGISNTLSRFVSRVSSNVACKQFADSDLVDFLSGSTDTAINFSRSADLDTPIHPLQ